jgi:putative salt-induced outer membrane protein YdiY
LTYDNYHVDDIDLPDDEDPPLESQVIHSARLFVGYENRLNEAVSLLTGIEGLLNVEEPENSRVNFNAALNSKLGGGLSVELRFMLMYDREAAERGRETVDTTTLANLVYSLL